MPHLSAPPLTSPLDAATRALVRFAAAAAGGTEGEVRAVVAQAVAAAPEVWVEEVVLQTYLFAGFPRALNAAREWRRITESVQSTPGRAPGAEASDYTDVGAWRTRGETTCAVVYGPNYEKLRQNIRRLHPALDEWMIVEGYGKVLARPGLDLARRELCIVAACARTGQDRQLHSHLHGAVHAGAPARAVDATLDATADLLGAALEQHARLLWARVRTRHE